jgi:hypothetical protein
LYTNIINVTIKEQDYVVPFEPDLNLGFGYGAFGYEEFGD